jgi:hypothetical protein
MNPLQLIPAQYRIAIEAIAVALIIGAIYATGHSHGSDSVQAKWDAAKTQQLAAQVVADQQARQREQSMIKQLQKAEYDAAQRETALHAAASYATAAAGSLRNDIAAIRGRVSADTAETCHATADTALAVFGECAIAIADLAVKADEHSNDALTCQDAWPK